MVHRISMLLSLGLVSLGLGLVGCKETPKEKTKPAPVAKASGCEKDTDCKGERICERRVCVEPKPTALSEAFTDPMKPPPAGKKNFVRESRLARLQLAKFSYDLKKFAKDNVECPLSLDAVTGDYPPDAFIDPWGNAYELVCDTNEEGKYVTVRSLGGDGQLGTDDDMPTALIPLAK